VPSLFPCESTRREIRPFFCRRVPGLEILFPSFRGIQVQVLLGPFLLSFFIFALLGFLRAGKTPHFEANFPLPQKRSVNGSADTFPPFPFHPPLLYHYPFLTHLTSGNYVQRSKLSSGPPLPSLLSRRLTNTHNVLSMDAP